MVRQGNPEDKIEHVQSLSITWWDRTRACNLSDSLSLSSLLFPSPLSFSSLFLSLSLPPSPLFSGPNFRETSETPKFCAKRANEARRSQTSILRVVSLFLSLFSRVVWDSVRQDAGRTAGTLLLPDRNGTDVRSRLPGPGALALPGRACSACACPAVAGPVAFPCSARSGCRVLLSPFVLHGHTDGTHV